MPIAPICTHSFQTGSVTFGSCTTLDQSFSMKQLCTLLIDIHVSTIPDFFSIFGIYRGTEQVLKCNWPSSDTARWETIIQFYTRKCGTSQQYNAPIKI